MPEHLRPLRPAAPARGWLWQVPLAVGLTLGALYLAAGLVPPCNTPGADCPVSPDQPDSPAPEQVTAPPAQSPPAPPTRPILRVAFVPLPLGMADAPPERVYTLPPGQTVADIATLPDAIALDRVNLIAVVAADGGRHALVRLADGRILRLREGDRLQGATVAAIGDDTLYMLRPDNTPQALVLGG